MKASAPNILICSAGRRNYLVRWFKHAAAQHNGNVIVADSDSTIPARSETDHFAHLPTITDPDYTTRLLEICDKYQIDLALSLNDYELSVWSTLDILDHSTTLFVRLPSRMQALVEDKLQLATHADANYINVPPTITAYEYLEGPDTFTEDSALVIKRRYGSASAGLTVVSPDRARSAVESLVEHSTDQHGKHISDTHTAATSVVVQRFIEGDEFGIDVINDLQRNYRGVLARQKLAMRGGETDKAITVSATPFERTSRLLSHFVGHIGIIDTDVIVDQSGTEWLIDVNPRFGGGYPFNHLAGADVPHTLIQWLTKSDLGQDHLEYRPGVISGKHIEISRTHASVV